MTRNECIAQLNALDSEDQESSHRDAETVLEEWLQSNHTDVFDAWMNCRKRTGPWWYA